MNVKVFNCRSNSEDEAKILLITKNKNKLPSISSGWRFNFNKHSKKKEHKTYTLTTLINPDVVEGCLIINTKTDFHVYMAFVEVAPHNKGNKRMYDKVAGCLIAFACRQSFMNDKEGYVAFDVIEEKVEDEIKLMTLYSQKYNAVRLKNTTTMIILPEGSEKLITEYLN
ncbi:hypothetical protein NBT05_13680 [Aquimarina sp. ERC-38]|uniref:hypothetical protein n=1 Tax=Aquimarina sp. ERC-38 TaxID=2949996 RepID=UPI002246BD6D|nr:hypothetical protein [Aquimarina sp. ERC-38]UZO79992.1 hypothetical protein NBT05_13680 [Aquimarina sp. ERC-38]